MAGSEDTRPAIGIDLGTTNCRVGIWLEEENRFKLISNDRGFQTTPSYVAFTETERLIGDAAKEQVSRNPANTVFDAKRLIGRKFSDLGTDADKMHIQWPFKVAPSKGDDRPMIHVEYKGREKAFSAVDIHSMLLGKLKDLAEVHSGSVVNMACVSVPHCFTSAQRQATRSACSLAGFESVTLVNEPVCAALAYTLQTIGPSRGQRSVVIFDLGGGALDVTVLIVDEGVVEVKATSGDAQLGGEDFDLRLLHHIITEIREKYERDVTSHPRVVRRLKKEVERVKLTLSSETEASLQIESLLEDFTFYSTVTRACFEEMNADLFERIMACVQDCLDRACLERKDVDEVVLIGGSSRIPKVVALLAEFFDASKLNTGINPDEAVVCGAAARAGIARGCGAFADYLVLDMLPMSLGVETADGGVHVMHPRYAAVPRSSEQMFTTVCDDQVAVMIRVCEGEHPQSALVATVELSGIAPAPSGVPQILVRFDVDANGILTVSAKDKATGEKVEVYMDQEVEIDQDDERHRGLAVQVYHHPSDPAGNPTSNVSESSPREFIEAASEDEPTIGTSQGSSEPVEACESGNTAESELQEISEPPSAFELSESKAEEISEPSPSFEASKAVENKAEEISEPSPSFEANKAKEISEPFPPFETVESRSQEPQAAPSESIAKAMEIKSQEISEPSPPLAPSPAFGSHEISAPSPTFAQSPAFEAIEIGPHEMSAPPPALESIKAVETQEIPEPISPSSPALRSIKSMENRPQEFFESSSAFDSSIGVEFFETSPVFESSNGLESKSLEFLEPSDTMEPPQPQEPPQPHEPTPAPVQPHESAPSQPHGPAPPQPHEPTPAPLQPRESAPSQPHGPAPPQPHGPAPPQPHGPAPPQPHEPTPSPSQPHEPTPAPSQPHEPTPAPPQPHEPPPAPPQPHEPTIPEPQASEFTLVQEILDTVHEIAPISDFRTHKRECATFIRRVNMLVPLFEEVRDLELAMSAELLACFRSLEVALVTAKDLLLLCSKGSKLWLVLEQRKVAERFLVLNSVLVQALDKLPDSLGISDEVREQVDLVHNQLGRSKAAEDAVDAQLSAELASVLDETNERSPDQLRSLAESFKLNTGSALQKELDALEWMTKEKAPGLVNSEGFDLIFGLLSGLRNLFPVEDSEQHGSVESISSAPSHRSNGIAGRSQEFSAHSLSNSIDAKSPEHSQVDREEKIMAQESSAPPSHSSKSVENRSQEFSAHSSSSSIDGKPLERSQVDREEKIMAQESSAPPSHSSKSVENRSQEFSAHSSSSSIDGKPLERSQVDREEKIMAQESSAPPSHSSKSVENRSQEFSAHSSSSSIDGKPLERSQVDREEKIMAQESSVPPSHSSKSVENRSQEFSAHSSGNSIDAKSPEHSFQNEKIMAQEPSAPPSHSSNSIENRSQEFSAHSSSSSIDGKSLERSQVDGEEKIMAQEPSAPPSHSSNSIESRSQEFSAQPQYSIDERSSQINTDERIKTQEPSAPPPQLPSHSREFPPRSPYSSSNSINGRSPQMNTDERIKAHETSASPPPRPLPSTSNSQEFSPRSPYSSSNGAQADPQGYAPSKSFRSSEFSEPLPTRSSTSTPENSQGFPEYSSKPEFPAHSPMSAASTHKLTTSASMTSPAPRSNGSSSSSSEANSEEFSGLIRGVQDAAAPDVPELRRAATGVDAQQQQHLPRPESSRSASSPQLRSDSIIEDVVKKYTWNQVLDMTNDLSKSIGKGGFGAVYLGKLENEKEVAVKVLDANSQQGITEFLNEVNLLKRVNHVNLVRLLGYCLEEKQVLIYEFAEEGSIWDHLQAGRKFLDWKTRLKVALESACGLEYLHTGCHPRIIHRDIKSQNILLTKSMVAKVADFGLSKLGADQDNINKTHVTTMVKGTLGYLDPEYLKTGQLTEKSDVYSFGVVLLEIITGRKPIQPTDRKGFIGDWVEDLYNSNNNSSRHLKHVVDPSLGSHYNSKALKLVVNIAKDCIHPYGIDRPEMTEVVHVLRKAQMIEHDEKKPSKWLPFL